MKELRQHVKFAGKLHDIYTCYPELFRSLKLADIVFIGLEVSVDKGMIKITPIDLLLFNFVYVLTRCKIETREFEK